MEMNAIVTGSSGFIGSNLSRELLKIGFNVVGIDVNNNYYSQELKNFRVNELSKYSQFSHKEIDISDFEKFDEIIRNFRPTFVFHLAAQAGVRIPLEDSNKYVQSNLVGFSTVLQSVLLNEIPNFLYASSSSVYGDNALIPYVESELKLNPNSFYGATKLSNEILTNSVIKGSRTRARGMRFFTVYGPAGRPDMAYFRIVSSLINGSNFTLFGDGSIERDFTYIDDCVEMVIRLSEELAEHKEGFSDIVNIGGGHPVSMEKLIELASKELNKELAITKASKNPKDVAKTMADSRYLMSLIGKKPQIKLEEGIKKTIQWATEQVTPEQLESWVKSSI